MAQTDELKDTQFAIQRGATFNFNNAGTVAKVNNDGSISITLNFTIQRKGDVQIGPGLIVVGTSGVFTNGNANSFDFKESSSVSKLTLSIDDLDRISFTSDENDIELITTADKGRQGDTFMIR